MATMSAGFWLLLCFTPIADKTALRPAGEKDYVPHSYPSLRAVSNQHCHNGRQQNNYPLEMMGNTAQSGFAFLVHAIHPFCFPGETT